MNICRIHQIAYDRTCPACELETKVEERDNEIEDLKARISELEDEAGAAEAQLIETQEKLRDFEILEEDYAREKGD